MEWGRRHSSGCGGVGEGGEEEEEEEEGRNKSQIAQMEMKSNGMRGVSANKIGPSGTSGGENLRVISRKMAE